MRWKIFTLGCLFLFSSPLFADTSNRVTVITDTVEFVMGSGFTAEQAYNRVLARAKRLAVDQASETYIQTYTRVENYRLTQDIVDAVHVGTIIEYSILWKNDDPEESGVQRIVMRAIVECPSIDELRRAVEDKAPEMFGVKKGELFVDSYPQGATIFIDGEKQLNKTPFTFSNIPEGKYDVTLKHETYRPKTVLVKVSPDDPQMVNVILQRPKGQIKITSNLKDAIVKVDNKVLGKAPITTDDLSIGVHDITVTSSEEYEPFTAEAEVYIDKIKNIHAELRKRRGRILVFVEPQNVMVRLIETGKSVAINEHFTFRDLEPMKYTLTATKNGYKFEGKTADLEPGKTVQIEFFGTRLKDLATTSKKVKKKGGSKAWWYIGGTAVIAGTATYFLLQEEETQGKIILQVPKRQ